ncbi:potassium transporter KefB [Dyadobacter psychrotolerans]|uniref:Potassium transporter KefB n=1 Tax=Dyadobacter psychrotolerans TaxID=2541721 RepID=A0A4R5DX32_9BACT|nr:potassium transporter KefB [Dyadobacter psychrotolerans]TDE15633.1 potassium transporter KefB [Dyadobacter psychrotolerans]
MTQQNELTNGLHPAPLNKRMLKGAGIALILITAFLLSAGESNPAWPKFWMIRPLVIVPLAGAVGGAVYYNLDCLRYQGGWKKVLANVLSLVIYIIGLWMGTILGLDGTMWD